MAPERPAVAGGRRRAVGEALAGSPGTVEVDPRERRPTLVRSQPRWPLSAHVVRQIRRQVARDGRSLQRLEVQGAVIDNFDVLGPLSPPSPRRRPSVGREPERRDADGAPGEDGDLTSLTWLQDRNLLRSINLSKGESDELRPAAARISPRASPPGLGREAAAARRSGGSRSRSGASGASPTSDYLEDSFTSEPADSSSSDQPPASPCASPPPRALAEPPTLDGPADSPGANGPASKAKHPHNVPYDPLVHVQNKPPYSFSCLIFMAIEDSPKKALPVKDIYSWILEHFPYFRSAPTGWKNSVRHNLSLNKCFLKVEKVQSLGKGSLWMVDDHYRSNLVQAFSRSPFHPCCPTPRSPSPSASPSRPASPRDSEDRVPNAETNGIKGAPNPELFPFLSRHLAASANGTPSDGPPEALSDHDSCDSSDEVVAAAMVLALKHGPGVLPPPLISSCPTQDHTYSSAATGSPEAGYGSDEEQRRTAEALLHLAGLPPAPELQSEMAHRPRLLRRAPKRPAQSFIANNGSPHHHAINNNCGNQADRNLLRVKRSRQHHL